MHVLNIIDFFILGYYIIYYRHLQTALPSEKILNSFWFDTRQSDKSKKIVILNLPYTLYLQLCSLILGALRVITRPNTEILAMERYYLLYGTILRDSTIAH